MARFPGGLLPFALLCAVASAQGDMKSRLLPITAPLRHAGVYHVATGTWTRGAKPGNLPGPVIYDNSCNLIYFTSMLSTESFQHRSRIPSPSGPTTDSIFYATSNSNHRYDERPGCADRYTITGFEVGYCSTHVGTIDWEYQFASSWAECGTSDMVPQYTITVTGLPGVPSTRVFNCWFVGLDLGGLPNGGMELSADGDGSYQGPSTLDQFGWSFRPSSPTVAGEVTGPIIAGNYTWVGIHGIPELCTGTDGTIWDSSSVGGGPTPPGERSGTGMSSNDFYRDAGGPVSGASGPGCYDFQQSNLHADFYLKLFSAPACGAPGDPVLRFCAPGVGGIVTCPCGNPQVPPGATRGCANFAAGTGGALLSGSGVPVAGIGDTLGFDVTAGYGSSVTVLFQGTTGSANARSGAGVRCVGGTLKRLYKKNQSGGAVHFPNNGVAVHDESSAKGYTIVAPITLYYYAAYRNSAANGHPGCPGTAFGFNTTNAGAVAWTP
jgi:hypothetical protein